MKKTIILLLTLFYLNVAQAQDAQLLDNDWYIEKVEIAGVEIVPPAVNCSKYGRVYFENENFSTENACCETGCSSNIAYGANDEFELSGKIPCLIDTGCSNEEWNFFTQHNGVYFAADNISFYNPYSYEITDNGDDLALVVTNGIGNKAYYGNVLLNTSNFEEFSVNVYPNPVTTDLHIKSVEPIKSIKVYTINGKQILQTLKTRSVDVSKLQTGFYFIEIVSQKGKLIKKFIKK
jgi:hypothetical protein